jgi:hypothetical protein
MAVNVTAIDTFGNRWTSGNPNFTFICGACVNSTRHHGTSGSTNYTFTVSTVGNYSLSVATSTDTLVAALLFTVHNAPLAIQRSTILGPLVMTSGVAGEFVFVPYDAFGNVAMTPPGSTALNTFDAVLRDLESGVEWPVNSTTVHSNSSAFVLAVASKKAGLFVVAAQKGALYRSMRPEATLGPIEVYGAEPSAVQSYLQVCPSGKKVGPMAAWLLPGSLHVFCFPNQDLGRFF